ncbi:MAG TPA: hypothetical protein VE130_14075 [Nitrososphaeraceae archaeon]|nr:hypothetical protein [Nitrososphaeraceae archaeon]
MDSQLVLNCQPFLFIPISLKRLRLRAATAITQPIGNLRRYPLGQKTYQTWGIHQMDGCVVLVVDMD